MSSIDQRCHPALVQGPDDFSDWPDQRGRAGDVIDQRQTGTRGYTGQHAFDDLFRPLDREGYRSGDDAPIERGGGELEAVAASVVSVIGGEQLVPRLEAKAAQN